MNSVAQTVAKLGALNNRAVRISAENINDMNSLEARLIISQLSEFQRKPASIEEQNVSGYDENWKDTFFRSGS